MFFDAIKTNKTSSLQLININQFFKTLDLDQYIHTSNNETVKSLELSDISIQISVNDFLTSYDKEDEDLLGFYEFNKLFCDIDLDGNASLREKEYEIIQKRISDISKVSKLNEKYQIYNSTFSTEIEKWIAKQDIDIIQFERKLNKLEIDKIKIDLVKENLIYEKKERELFYDSNVEPTAESRKLKKDIVDLNTKLECLKNTEEVMNANILLVSTNLSFLKEKQVFYQIKFDGLATKSESECEKDLAALEQNLLVSRSEYQIAVNNQEIYHKNEQIVEKTKLIQKFYIPEFQKENERRFISFLKNEIEILNKKNLHSLNSKELAGISQKIISKSYEYEKVKNLPEFQDKAESLKTEITLLKKNKELQMYSSEISYREVLIAEIQFKMNKFVSIETDDSNHRMVADFNSQIEHYSKEIEYFTEKISDFL